MTTLKRIHLINSHFYTSLREAIKRGQAARLSEIVRACLIGVDDSTISDLLSERAHMISEEELAPGAWPQGSGLSEALDAWQREWLAAPILQCSPWPQLEADQAWQLLEWHEVVSGGDELAHLPWPGITTRDHEPVNTPGRLSLSEERQIEALAPNLKKLGEFLLHHHWNPEQPRCERLLLTWHSDETRIAIFAARPLPALAPHQSLLTSPEAWWAEVNATCPPEFPAAFSFGDGDA